MKKTHIDDGTGNALCGIKKRGGTLTRYNGDNPDIEDYVTKGAVHSVEVKKAVTLHDACGSSAKKCLNCCKKWKKLNGFS